jgi:hypothetical protein
LASPLFRQKRFFVVVSFQCCWKTIKIGTFYRFARYTLRNFKILSFPKGLIFMNRKFNSILLAAIGLILGLCLTAVFYQTRLSASAKAQESNSNQITPKKWEYCSVYAVNGVFNNNGKSRVTAIISYARGDGFSSETIDAAADYDYPGLNFAQSHALAKAVAKLGEDGWDMAADSEFREQKVLYFKRPKK